MTESQVFQNRELIYWQGGGAEVVRPCSSVDRVPILEPVQAAWLAGFLDGEGHFAAQRTARKSNGKQYYIPILQVSQAGEQGIALVQQIQEELGGVGTYVFHNHANKPGNFKDAATLMLYGEPVVDICYQLLPYLRLKKRHAEILSEWPRRRVIPLGRGRGTAPDLETEALHMRLFDELRTLNARGRVTKAAEA